MYKAAGKLFSGGIAGKALGVVRELVQAALFGTGAAVDAFRASMTGVFISSHLFTTDSLNAGFIPLYARYQRDTQDKAHALFWLLTAILGGLSTLIAAALFIGARPWVRLLVPGFGPEAFEMAVTFTRVMAIGVPFYVQSTLFSYLEMGNARYTLASIRATVQNVGVLGGIVAAFFLRSPVLMAWGFTGAYVLFFFIGWTAVVRQGHLRRPPRWVRPETGLILREFWRVVQPVLLLSVIVQLNFFFERIVASMIGSGVVASLEYARAISETGMVLIAWPVGLAGLAELSRVSKEEALARLKELLPVLLLILVPASLFMALYSGEIIRVLYARGRFDAESVRLTQAIFVGLAAGFWAQVIAYVLFRALNALLRNRELAVFTALGFTLNIALNFLAYRRLGALALGFSASAGGLLMLLLSAWALGLGPMLLRFLGMLLAGAAVCGCVAWLLPGAGAARLIAGAAWFALYWGLWARCVPPFWNATRELWTRKSADHG